MTTQPRNVVFRDTHNDAPCLAWPAGDEALALELQDHAVDRRRGDAEEGSDVGLSGCATVEEFVSVDEGEVLALLLGELGRVGDRRHASIVIDGAGGGHDERKVPHHADD